MKVCAVIPAYNPGSALVGVCEGVADELGKEHILVVDDGCSDGSLAAVAAFGVRILHHPHNMGKGRALRTGFEAALAVGADLVLTLDADGQHAPGDIPRFIERAERGDCQLIIGTRMAETRNMPPLRVFANRFTSSIVSFLARQRIADSQSGYRLMTAELLRAVDLELERYDAESEILVRASLAGFRICSVPIQTIYGDERSAIHPLVDSLRFARLTWRLLWLRRHLSTRAATGARGTDSA